MPQETLTNEIIFNTHETEQEKGLQAAVAYGQKQGWDLMSVIWDSENSEGHQLFTILYNKPQKNLKKE